MRKVGKLPKAEQAAARTPLVELGRSLREQEKHLAEAAEQALANAASEALTFSGIEAGAMDVGFFASDDPVVAKLAKVGLRFDLPQGEGLQQTPRMAPGMDPSKPPILK